MQRLLCAGLGLSLAAASVACGQLAEDGSLQAGANAEPPSASATANPGSAPGSAPPHGPGASAATPSDTNGQPKRPVPAVCDGAPAAASSDQSAGSLAIAVQGLWIGCSGATTALCPTSDAILLIGDLSNRKNTGSRAASCGNLTSHGSGFIPDPSAAFTYEIVDGGGGAFTFHAWNASADRTFDVIYFGVVAAPAYEDAMSLTSADASGALRRTSFTTY